jgi:hypothetical protein
MRELILFKKQRELGDILTDTFKFIRLQGKYLFTLILKITGPALSILLLSYVYYMYATLGSFDNIFIEAASFEGFATNVIVSILLMVFAMIVFYTLLHCTVLCYIQSYINNDGVVSEQEVRDGVKASFWSILGSGVLVNIMVVIGFLFCGIPGFYLGVVLASTMRSTLGKYTIPAEIKYGHNRGALAAAKEYRANPDDRSSSYEFYIVQSSGGANHLNPNYTVFGRVTSGMEVVDKIAKLETDGSEWPYSNVFIEAKIKD